MNVALHVGYMLLSREAKRKMAFQNDGIDFVKLQNKDTFCNTIELVAQIDFKVISDHKGKSLNK